MSTALQLAWTQVWQTAAVALAVAIVVRLIGRRRPHLAYLLWLVVIAKSLTPPIWSSPAGVFSWATIAQSTRSTVELPPATRVPIVPSPAPTALAATTVALPSALDSESRAWPHAEWLTATNVLALVWLAGTAIFAAVLVANWFRIVSRLRRTALPIEPAWREQFDECTRKLRLRRHIRFLVTSEPVGPAVCGVFRPVIVLPHSLFAKEASALEAIVAHELAHIRRGDALAALFQALAQCVWWFHPCVLWANRQANRERERACDEEVLATFRLEAATYAQSLLDVLRMKQTLRPVVAFPGVRAIEVTTRRLEHIMQAGPMFHARTPHGCWAIALVTALAALPGAGLAFDSEPKAAQGANEGSHEGALINRVLNDWQDREAQLKSLHVAWQTTSMGVYHKRSLSGTLPAKEGPVPRGDRPEELWMKGNAYRVGVATAPNRGGRWQAFDGLVTRIFEGRDRAAIFGGDLGIQHFDPRLFPILLFARPLSQCGFDPSAAKWRLLGENAIVNNRHCVKLATTRNGSEETIWADPERDDVIVGWEERQSRGRWPTTTIVTIDYRRDEKHGWIPTRWIQQQRSPRGMRSIEQRIGDCSIDEPIPNEMFAAFPLETTVLDTRTLKRFHISKTGAQVPIEEINSPEALKIAKSLEQPVDFTIDPQPLEEALGFIATRYQIKVAIDPAVEFAGVDSSMEVKYKFAGIRLKELITALLKQAPRPLVYRVENGALMILPAPQTK